MDKEETSQVTAAMEKVNLKSSDGEMFEVDMKVASLSNILKNTIDNLGRDGPVPVPNVAGNILAKVIEYCEKHAEAIPTEDLKEWDAEFLKVDQATLLDLVKAASYLDIPGLLDVTSQSVAHMIADKSPEEIRMIFGIENDFTPQEEEALLRENLWAFQRD